MVWFKFIFFCVSLLSIQRKISERPLRITIQLALVSPPRGPLGAWGSAQYFSSLGLGFQDWDLRCCLAEATLPVSELQSWALWSAPILVMPTDDILSRSTLSPRYLLSFSCSVLLTVLSLGTLAFTTTGFCLSTDHHDILFIGHQHLIGLDLEIPQDLSLVVLNQFWRCFPLRSSPYSEQMFLYTVPTALLWCFKYALHGCIMHPAVMCSTVSGHLCIVLSGVADSALFRSCLQG